MMRWVSPMPCAAGGMILTGPAPRDPVFRTVVKRIDWE
jgi:hypothetical protein